jgi:type 1 glutamine amidotransferase
MSDPIRAHLVCGGKYHDFDFARKELLALLYEDVEIRTSVSSDYRDTDAIAAADFLVTYTCSLAVGESEERALAEFVRSGRRWLALHGTNSVLEFVKEGVAAPREQQLLMRTLGSQFIAHPPIQSYRVDVSRSAIGHPLVAGIESFEVDDELYLCAYHGEIQPLLETRFSGEAVGFVEKDWHSDDARLVMYLHPEGKGQVLYLTLGHCRGKYDMRPAVKYYPRVERGAWAVPAYYELLRRGIRWAAKRDS